jgi:hypothetical protein
LAEFCGRRTDATPWDGNGSEFAAGRLQEVQEEDKCRVMTIANREGR